MEQNFKTCLGCGVLNADKGARNLNGVWRTEKYISHMNSGEGLNEFGAFPHLITIKLLNCLCQKCYWKGVVEKRHVRRYHQSLFPITLNAVT